ncbi:retrotransposon protein [Cucumis melo var. makuwa]|uniref:Retrotransposon protein n=1 Tax=Cucumis melo var. makuwa TaxID=1194695 RepID=A0A5D3CBM6_CUCMM|nr:retrotransposon protein [Cucumis melo var. makuwa]TYK07719.1 retrotransposon protein [Cucumis melo var. makuwa]
MTYCDNVDEGDSTYVTTITSEDIHYIETTNEWSQWHDKLFESMFTDSQLRGGGHSCGMFNGAGVEGMEIG